ncbi:MAG TPA: SRPBCC family protein [Streptosporangiaceae bacterium]
MEMRAEVTIDVVPAAAWAVVGAEFGQIGQWCSAIRASFMDGPPAPGRTRTCQIAGFGPVAAGVIRERLVTYDADAMSLSYEATEGMPGFIRRAVSNWSVRPAGYGRCAVRIHATLTLTPLARPLAPLLRWRLRADTRRVLEELRYRIQAGQPHPAKAAVMARRAR